MRQTIAADRDNGSSIKMERLGVELESALDKDTIYVTDCDSGKSMDPLMSCWRQRQDLYQHRSQHPRLGHGGGDRRQAGAARPAGGLFLGDG